MSRATQVRTKIITFLAYPWPEGYVNSPFESNAIPYSLYCHISLSELDLFVVLTAPNKQFLRVNGELRFFAGVLYVI